MLSYQSLGKELECPICLDYLNLPKVMGQCLHSACFECLEKLVAMSHTRFFSCPVCRRRCKIPKNGAADLKDDFRLRAIVEKYHKIGDDKGDDNVSHCTACPNLASHFCEMCEKVYLCEACTNKHSQDPLTAEHRLVRLCTAHLKSLTMYCKKCDKAICNVCLIANHPSSSLEHDVIPHQKIADEETAEVMAAVEELGKTKEQKANELRSITDINDNVMVIIASDLRKIAQQSDIAIENTVKKYTELKTKQHSIENQAQTLTTLGNSVEKEIAEMELKETSIHQKREEYSQYLNRYRDLYRNKFEKTVNRAVAENEEMKVKLEHGRNETSLKRVLDEETVPRLKKIKKELSEASSAAQQIDLLAPFVAAKNKLFRFVLVRGEMELGFIQRRFTTLKKFADVSDPGDRPCKFLDSVRYLPDGRLASLYRYGVMASSDTISLHNQKSSTVCEKLINKWIFPAQDMVVTSKGELIVLRLEDPAVRVFDSRTGRFHNIYIKVAKDEISQFKAVESDEEGNIFVADYKHLRVFSQFGTIITEVVADLQGLQKMSYCRLRRTLYIASNENILMYRWDGATFQETLSFAHGIEGFRCNNICICNEGDLFIGGDMCGCNEICIYQGIEHATLSDDDEDIFGSENKLHGFKMARLNFDDNIKRGSHLPSIGVFGRTLALGYGGKLELFELIP